MKKLINRLLPAGVIAGMVAGLRLWITNASDMTADPIAFAAIGAWSIVVYGIGGGLIAGAFAVLYRGCLRIRGGDTGTEADVREAAAVFLLMSAAALLTHAVLAGEGTETRLYMVAASVYLLVAGAMSHRVKPSAKKFHTPLAHMVGAVGGAMVFAVALRAVRAGVNPVGSLGKPLAVVVAIIAGYLFWYLTRAILRTIASRTSPVAANVSVGGILAAAVIALALFFTVSADYAFARAAAALPAASAGIGSPNIILISVDTLRADFVGYGGGQVRTPTIDALAEESYIFAHAYSVAPWTRPSFAAFFTSRYPSEMGVGRLPGTGDEDKGPIPFEWRADRQLLAEVFKKQGYSTAAVVTNPNLAKKSRANQGFDVYYHCATDGGRLPDPVIDIAEALFDLPHSMGSVYEKERAQVISSRSIDLIKQTSKKPLFFWAHYMDPHYPYDPPDIDADRRFTRHHLPIRARQAVCSPTSRHRFLSAYAAEVEYYDDWLAPVIDQLKVSGLWDSSIVVFWSDHGEEFWEHGGWGHGQSLFNDQLHVPLLIHLPGQTDGHTINEPVTLLDVMPTILDYCDAPEPPGMRGKSLLPLMNGGEDTYQCEAFLECCVWGGARRGLLTDRWKLIYDLYESDFSLYAIQNDPRERRDLYGTVVEPEIPQMEKRLLDWIDDTHAMMQDHIGGGVPETLSPDIQQNLKDMGYVQ